MTRDECGTRAGYRIHLRRGEPTCQACRDASADYRRARKTAFREWFEDIIDGDHSVSPQ